MVHLLIVDDDPHLLELTKTYLEQIGDFTVDTATSACEALEMMETTTYDAIVSDYQMPEMDGIEFLKTIRGTGSDIPFIIFTGKGREYVVIEALNAGADLYLQKGGHPKAQFAELTGMIKHAVERNQAKEELNTAYKHMQAAFEKAKDSEETLTIQNKRLEKSEERYRNVVEGQTELISRFLPYGTHVFVNEAYCRYFGKRREEIMGHRFLPSIPSEDQELVKNHFASLTPDHPVDTIEHRIIMPDSEICWQRWSDRAIFDEKGTIIEYQSVGRDITDLKIDEAAVRQKLEFEETLAAAISRFTGIYDFDDAVNGALADMGRVSRADRDYLFLVREGDIVADNTHEWCAKGVSPQIDNLQSMPLEMFPWWREKICNREIIHIGDISKLPPEAEAERENLEMQKIRSLIVLPVFCGDEPAGFLGFDSIRETGEWTEEVILILRTVAEIIGKSLELKRMQGAIRESEEKFRALAENSPDTIMRFDRHCRHLYVNSVVEQQTNIQAEEFIGKTHSELGFPNDLVELWEGAIQEVFATKKKNNIEFKLPGGIWIEWLLVPEFSSDGEVKVVIAAGRDITELKRMQGVLEESEERFRLLAASTPVAVLLYQDNRFVYANPAAEEISGYSEAELCQMNIWDVVHPDYVDLIKERGRGRQRGEKNVNRYEFKIITKAGEEKWVDIAGDSVLLNRRPAGIISLLDITERKAAEQALDSANKKLRILSSITRHDIINHVTGLAGYTDLLNDVLPDDPEMRKYINRITKATSAIERQITFSRDYQSLGLDPSRWQRVADALSGCTHITGVNVSIGTGTLEIFADPMLEKVFFNLFDNAVRHGEYVTEITVTCREEDESGKMNIAVEDDGVGIPAERKKEIFRHGFGKHTGYGLFLVQEILSITGISIRETGEEGKGARFEIIVPPGGWRMSHSEEM